MTEQEKEKDTLATYKLLYDVYKTTHEESYDSLHRSLKEALNAFPEDAVIYMLMEEVKEHRNMS